MSCKDKERSKVIRERAAKIQEKILIGNSYKGCKNLVNSDRQADRVKAASQLGQIRMYRDERGRILSIVASEFSYSKLKEYFRCSHNTITAARVHATLFGRGWVASEGMKFTRQVLSKDVLDEFLGFLTRDDISRASSCHSVLVDGKKTPVRYWLQSLKDIVQLYTIEHPSGVKRSYIYSHLLENFRMNCMLAGVCNICDDSGHSNFENLQISQISQANVNTAHLVSQLRSILGYFKSRYSNEVSVYSVSLCIRCSYKYYVCTRSSWMQHAGTPHLDSNG